VRLGVESVFRGMVVALVGGGTTTFLYSYAVSENGQKMGLCPHSKIMGHSMRPVGT
jgi:hypothetical protein